MIGQFMEGPWKTFLVIIAAALILTPSFMISSNGTRQGERSETRVTPIDDPEMHPLGFFRGILPNPYPGQDLYEVYGNASMHSQFVPVWGRPSPFYNLSDDLEGTWGDLFVDDLIRENGMFPLVHMSFFRENLTIASPESIEDPSLSNMEWRSLYRQSALDIVNASRPRYLSLGNEVNRWNEHHGDDPQDENAFRHFISLYNETYDAVKQISPDTKIFCTFAREVVSENRKADMSFLERFDPGRQDMIVLTTYPHSVQGINRVSDIPDDYYSSVFDHTEKKQLGFSEAAWPSLAAFGGEQEQITFIDNITGRLTETSDLHLLGWPWLHDIGPTDATGLRYNDGTEKSSLEKWRMNTEPTYNRSNRIIDIIEDSGMTEYNLTETFSDPDPWDELNFRIWNGTDYTNKSEDPEIESVIEGDALRITTKDNQTGNVFLQVRAEDMAGETNWTVILVRIEEVNDPPALIDPVTYLPLKEGDTAYVELSDLITDAEDPVAALEINITESPRLLHDLYTFPEPYMYIHPEDPDWFGRTYMNINVTDSDGATSELTLTVEYLPVEDPPVLKIADTIEMVEDTTISINVSGWWADPDPGDIMNITLFEGYDQRVSMTLENETLTITPDEDFYGSTIVSINVTDGVFNVTEFIELIISPVNDPPRSTFGGADAPPVEISLLEDAEKYFDLDALISPYDPEGEVIIYTLKNGSGKIRTIGFEDNGTMRVIPFPDANGQGSFRISLRDPSGGETKIDFQFNIRPVNDPPLFITPGNWSVTLKRGDHYEIDLSGETYVAEDIEEELDNLTMFINSDLCRREGHILIIDIPENIDWEHKLIDFYLVDSQGARSEIRTLNVTISDPLPANGYLSISTLNITMKGDDLVVIAEGLSYQEIWVVIQPDSGASVSEQLVEGPPGYYYLRWENIAQGYGSVEVYLSRDRGGPNDSGFEAKRFDLGTERDNGSESEGDDFPFEAVSLTALVILIVIILASIARRKKKTWPEE